MSFLQRGLLAARIPIVECKRFRGKINIQRPALPHYERQLAIDVCLPSFVKKREPPKCANFIKDRHKRTINNPFEKILANEFYNWLSHSNMVAFLHLNSAGMDVRSKLFRQLRMKNMHLRMYGRKIVEMATKDTNYEVIQKLFCTHTNIIFSEEIQVPAMLKLLKITPQLILMGGIVDGKLLSRNEFVEYGNLPDIQIMRAQLCNILHSAGSAVADQLNQHQRILVGHLEAHAAQLTKTTTSGDEGKPSMDIDISRDDTPTHE